MENDIIHLVPLDGDWVRVINENRNNQELINNLGSPFRFTPKEIDEKWYDNYLSDFGRQERAFIVYKNTSEIIGMVSLTNIDLINSNAEFSIQLYSHRGKGIGKMATAMMVEHGFMDLNLHRIYLTVLKKNEAAIGCYLSCGFRTEGTLRGSVFKDGYYNDQLIMSILSNDC